MRQRYLDGQPQAEQLGAEGETAGFRQRADLFPPRLQKGVGADIPLFGGQQLELHGGDVGRRVETGRPDRAFGHALRQTDRENDPRQQRRRVFGPAPREPVEGPPPRRFQLPRHLVRPSCSRALGHPKVGRRDVALHLLAEVHSDDPRGH